MEPNNKAKLPDSPLQATAATFRLVGVYAIFACLWVLFSDDIARSLPEKPEQILPILAAERGLFVIITLLLLWIWMRRLIRQVKDYSTWEQRLKEKSRHVDRCLSALVESSTDAIFAKDLQGRYFILNREAARMAGKSSDSILGEDDSFLFPSDQIERIRSHDLQVIAENKVIVRETSLTMTDGAKRTFLSTKGPLHDDDGKVMGIFGISRDITAQKRSEEALRKDEANFRSMFEENSSPILLIDHVTGEIIDANMAALAFYGYPKEEFLRMRIGNFDAASPEKVADDLRHATGRERKAHYFAHQLASGEIRDVELHATYIIRDGRAILLCIVHDVTQRKETERSRHESEERLRLALTVSKQGWFDIDLKSGNVTVSEEYIDMTGYAHDEFPASVEELLAHAHPEDRDAVFTALLAGSKDGKPITIEYRQRRKNGDYRWVRSIGKIVEWDAKGYASRLIGIQADITERKELEEQIRQLAFFDPLTALPNRRLLHDRLNRAMETSKRSGRYGAIMFADMDNFKPLNDTHGHEVGDLLLIEVANRLASCVRAMDTVARFGGDEFVIMICELNTDRNESVAQARAVAEKIRLALAKPYILKIQEENGTEKMIEHHCTASIGVTLFVNHRTSFADILKEADLAMYAAKETGRNMIRFHEADENGNA